MADRKNYSKREIDMITQPLTKHLESQDAILVRIEAQTTKTNGRVTMLEEKTKGIDDLKNKQAWMLGVGAAIIVMAGVIWWFALNTIDTKITDDFNACCQAIINSKK